MQIGPGASLLYTVLNKTAATQSMTKGDGEDALMAGMVMVMTVRDQCVQDRF
jgi:hypothetical protein